MSPLTNARESALGTNPRSGDSDGDELPDGWEADHGLDATSANASADLDGDGVSNLDEYRHQTDPQRPHPGWVYFALPSDLIPLAASPTGTALLRDDTHYWRWATGNLNQLGEYSDQVRIAPRTYRSTSAVLNRGGDVAIQTIESRAPRNEDGNVSGDAVQTRVYPASGAPTWGHAAPTFTAVSDFTDGVVSDENGNFVRWERHTQYSNHFEGVALGEDGALWGIAPVGVESFHDDNLNANYQRFRTDLLRVPPGGGAGASQRARVTAFRGLDAQGRAIGQFGPDGSEAFVGTATVAYTPSAISAGGQVIGYVGISASAFSGGPQRLYADATGAGRVLPASNYPYYFDAQERLNERAWHGAGFEYFLLTPTLPDGGWRRIAHVALPLPAGWTSAHRIAPGSESAQLGYASIAGAPAQPFLALPNPARLLVDNDRDGQITPDLPDLATPERPFRFWSNDDDDEGDDKRAAADDIPLPEGDSKRDSENTKVDGIRDLEDFFPIYFDIKQLLTVLPPGTNGISYYLKQEDSALGVVFTSYTRTQAFDYLRGSPAALDTGFGPALTQKAGDATVVKITAAGVNISTAGQPTASPAFFDRIKNNDGGVLLIEASKATTKPLVLEVRKGADVIAEIALPLKIDPVETMFHYVNLRSFAHGTPIASNNQGPGYGSTTPSAAPNDPFATVANRKNMVFIHGYNVNGEGARGAAATAFKRFHWSGSKAKFYAVLWRGDDGQGEGIAPAGATPDYHRNVGHAWQQGPLFRDFLGTLQGDTAIMAHSLGNGVTKVALTRTRDPGNPARLVPASKPATVKHYFAVDSALPLEATSASDITAESKSRMRHSWWAEYDSQERLWPTHWHELFAGTGDGCEGLTWQNVFANLEVGTNFYSSGEEVLANPLNDTMPVWEPLFFAGLRAWIAQEKHKGGNGVAASFFRSWTAGWVENEAWYVPIVPTPPFGSPQARRRFASEAQDVAAPNGVPSSALPAEPFFKRFQASESGGFYPGYQGSRLHAPIGDTNADDEARKLVTVAKCLGEAIPALSYPQGSNPATKFDRLSGNFDLNEPYNPSTGLGFKNGWPASRPNQNWLHSDCLDVSYIFHFKFYDRMKTDGGLQ